MIEIVRHDNGIVVMTFEQVLNLKYIYNCKIYME